MHVGLYLLQVSHLVILRLQEVCSIADISFSAILMFTTKKLNPLGKRNVSRRFLASFQVMGNQENTFQLMFQNRFSEPSYLSLQ
jgi:hypothetical protein